MPQKNIFTKSPLLTTPNGFLSCGLIRTEDPGIVKLYEKAQSHLDTPSGWEGAFRLAAMVTDNPLAEPVAGRILSALAESEDGSFSGTTETQIATARAAMALFEYNTDRSILKRIASWCRYVEIEWDPLFQKGRTLFCPADLMELLIRFYQASGIKSVLRICTKLRSGAFDWTTTLHTVQQAIPLASGEEEQISFIDRISPREMEYDQKQVLLNHAEMLANGTRYSLYAGIFSGNKQDLTAGKAAWHTMQKHYRAICGGTTAGPFLSGDAANARISTAALAEWTEAFAAQMLLADSEWAADELIRIVFNGLDRCLRAEELPGYQRVNNIREEEKPGNADELYAKVTRAAAAAFRAGITIRENGLRINYLMPAKYLTMFRRQAVILHSDGDAVRFSSRADPGITVDLFRARTETASVTLQSGGKTTELPPGKAETGQYTRLEGLAIPTDRIRFEQKETIYSEKTHHQGICRFVRNRLMAYECGEKEYSFAATEAAEARDGTVRTTLCRIEGWPTHQGQPDDIPVLPGRYEEKKEISLVPYSHTRTGIAMFPRINPVCLK